MQERTGHAWGEGGGGHTMPRKGGKRCETPARAAAKETGDWVVQKMNFGCEVRCYFWES